MRYTEFLKQHLQHQPLKVERLKPTWLMFSPLKMENFSQNAFRKIAPCKQPLKEPAHESISTTINFFRQNS